MCPLLVFHAETQTLSFIHTCTRNLILPVETRKLWAELKFAEVHAFFKYWLEEGPASDQSLAVVYTVTSPWVVNLPSSHHSHSPLVNRKNVQHSSRTHARASFGLNISMRQRQWPANLLCKCFKGRRNVLSGAFEL